MIIGKLAIKRFGPLLGLTLALHLTALSASAQLVPKPDRVGFWHQDSPDILGTNEVGDVFGRSLTSGDFNNDGYPDLAIGAHSESIGDISDAGTVHVIYGGVAGLQALGNQVWSQDSPGIDGVPEPEDLFGSSVTNGDFNGDGFDDLAVGAPWDTVSGEFQAGAVNIIYGGPGGLTADGNQYFTQDTPGIGDDAEETDLCGWSVAAGDLNHDGYADLAFGCHYEDLAANRSGVVHVVYGSAAGLAVEGNQIWHQDVGTIEGVGEKDDFFGIALTTGDFNNDGYSDLAVGVEGESVGEVRQAGSVNVIYGGMAGLTDAGNQIWNQDQGNIVDTAEEEDRFGRSLASGDFNGDGFDDLAVGVHESFGPLIDEFEQPHEGAVAVIYGSGAGLADIGNQLWHQDSTGILGVAEAIDAFGHALTAGDFDNDGFDDLAIGVLYEDIEGEVDVDDTGAVNVIYGRPGGLSSEGNQLFTQNNDGLDGDATANDSYGYSLATGDFDLDGFDDLAIGVQSDTVGGIATGSVNVLHGSRPEALLSDIQRQLRALAALRNLLSLLAMLP